MCPMCTSALLSSHESTKLNLRFLAKKFVVSWSFGGVPRKSGGNWPAKPGMARKEQDYAATLELFAPSLDAQ